VKSCPFCIEGAGAVRQKSARSLFVECIKCGAGSEPKPTPAEAEAEWVRRVRAPEARPTEWTQSAKQAA